jgi:glycosyltransferase involved in cell wall biosynthesis
MRILTVIQHFYPVLAGAEKFGQELAEAFHVAGHESLVATARWNRSWREKETINGIQVYRHPVWWIGGDRSRQFAGITYMFFLFVFLIRHRSAYDVLLVHQAHKGAFISVLARRLLRKPVVVVIHCAGKFGDIQVMKSTEYGFYTRFMLNTIKQSDAFVAICSDIRSEMESEGFQRVTMIHDGIVPWQLHGERTYASGTRLVTLARLHPQKGIDVLIQALALLPGDLPWTADICGEGPERERLEQLTNVLGLSSRVTFRGFVRDTRSMLQESDIFVLPSRGEGMGIALLEAMHAGLPSVVTRVSGFVDVAEHGVNAYMVASENPVALASALEVVMRDESLRRRLGEAGRKTVEQRFTLASTAKQYLALLESIVSSTRPHSERKEL